MLQIVQGDLTRETTDAIVNAANSTLLGGGGVDGAIHAKGGPAIREECARLRASTWPDGLPAGEAVITGAGRLPCRHVIHTVGPVWLGGREGEAQTLSRCYKNSLALAAAHGLTSVAFPSISTGAYGYPVDKAALVALRSVREMLDAGSPVTLVRFVLFSARDLETYERALKSL
jgi:O-acetyl-ADP-ribose deacetylase (regulator of RNase III)